MAEKAVDAIKLLTDDHKNVKQLFREFEGLTDRAMKRRSDLYMQIRHELEIHTKVEERFFYPVARQVTEDLVPEAIEEHHVVAQLLHELSGMDPSDERFDAKMTVLIENVEHHAEEEEKEMFPSVKKELSSARLLELGAQMAQGKQTMQQELDAVA